VQGSPGEPAARRFVEDMTHVFAETPDAEQALHIPHAHVHANILALLIKWAFACYGQYSATGRARVGGRRHALAPLPVSAISLSHCDSFRDMQVLHRHALVRSGARPGAQRGRREGGSARERQRKSECEPAGATERATCARLPRPPEKPW
jgi:hypothetical protein